MSKLGETIKVILWLALIAFVWGFLLNASAHANTLNQLASTLSGKPVTVECFAPDYEVAGYIVVKEDKSLEDIIHLDGEVCGALKNILNPGPKTARWARSWDGSQELGGAILTLTHEAMHQKLQSLDEGLVECTSVRNVWNSTKLLTLAPKTRKLVYNAAVMAHKAMPTTGINAIYRSVC